MVRQTRNIFLIGPMGAGKSTIGRLLADRLGLAFKDSDQEIEARAGADIPWIFDVEGEEGFRRRETAVLADLTLEQGIVLATGGGAIIKPENRKLLAEGGVVVYLAVSIEQQYARTRRDRQRPLLHEDDPYNKLSQLFAEREPLYLAIADFVIATDRRTPRLVVQEILRHLGQDDLPAQ